MIRITRLVMAGLLGIASSGCISTNGALQPNTQFVYPNSNVTVLGHVESSRKKFGPLFFVPSFTSREVLGTYREALQAEDGANVIVNFDESTIVSNFILFNTIEYRISGQGAKMEVGRQILR